MIAAAFIIRCMKVCVHCSGALKRQINTYCSNKCQIDNQFETYIKAWKSHKTDGMRGLKVTSLSQHIVRYLREKYGNACSICGWNTISRFTHKVPLEVDHIDGDARNNDESNLRLICPNCHSLTASYRNLNRGNGRNWRREKYLRHT